MTEQKSVVTALAYRGVNGGGKENRHLNPNNNPIMDGNELQMHYEASGADESISKFIVYLGNEVGLTDNAILKTIKTHIAGRENTKGPMIYGAIEASLKTKEGLLARVNTHKRLGFTQRIEGDMYPHLAEVYAEVYGE